MMDKLATRAVEDFVHAGYDLEAEAILLAESDGTREEVADEVARMIAVMRASGATDVRCLGSEAERLRFWSGRKAAFPAVGRISPDYYCIDGSIPRAALSRVLARIGELSRHYALRCANVFHAGDGNLHPLILYDANVPGELERTEAFAARHPRAVHRGGRHDHRRARRGHREDQPDVHAVPARGARAVPRRQGGVRPEGAAESRARACPRCIAARSTARCA
jgi:glycolate oxidase